MPDMVDFSLYLITDRSQVAEGHTLVTTVEAALRGGVKAVQLREKDLSASELRVLAQELRGLTRRYGARLFINDNVEIALAVRADGVHLGGHSRPTGAVRKQLGQDMLIGVSTHSSEEIRMAQDQGADFVTFGPVYATPSKLQYGPPQGLKKLADACRGITIPVFALGGITPARTAEVRRAGAGGIALIAAIIASPDPCAAAESFSACGRPDLE